MNKLTVEKRDVEGSAGGLAGGGGGDGGGGEGGGDGGGGDGAVNCLEMALTTVAPMMGTLLPRAARICDTLPELSS